MRFIQKYGGFLFLIPLLLVYASGNAQNDSLRLLWSRMPADTHSVRWLHQRLRTDRSLSPDSLFSLASEGAKLAERLSDKQGLAFMQLYQGLAFAYKGDFSAALELFEQSLTRQLEMGDTLQAGKVLINTGLAYYYLGNNGLALVSYEQAADYLHLRGQQDARLFNNIAMIYRKQEKYSKADDYYQRSLAIKQAENDSAGLANTWFNLATLRHQQGNSTQALAYGRMALRYYMDLGDKANESAAYTVIGSIFIDNHQPDSAEIALNIAGGYFDENPDAGYALETLTDIARLAAIRKNWPKAESFFLKALSKARSQGRKEEEADIHRYLSRALYEQGKYQTAYSHSDTARLLDAEINDALRLALSEEMQARFEVDDAIYEQKMQQLAFRQQQRISLILLTFAGVIIIAVLFFLYQKNRVNRILKSKNEVIAGALSEKEFLIREIHHRVKNNLQFISSLLRLQTRHLEDAQARDVLMTSRSRVLAMAMVHRHLYLEDQLTTVPLNEYLGRLIDELAAMHINETCKVSFNVEIEPISLDIDQAVPLGLIVNELVINSMKYAFTGRETGTVNVLLKQTEHELVLNVADDGVGGTGLLEENDRTGFGYRLVQLLAEKLKAKLTISSDQGMIVNLAFPFTVSAP
ncbi:MAG: histidine kinase dimerization/phosphoacceptor domain -containing protein [Bacteroidia bacterium]